MVPLDRLQVNLLLHVEGEDERVESFWQLEGRVRIDFHLDADYLFRALLRVENVYNEW